MYFNCERQVSKIEMIFWGPVIHPEVIHAWFHSSCSIGTPVNIQVVHSSKLTLDNPTYYRDCEVPQCHYESVQIHVHTKGLYVLWSESTTQTYGYIYEDDFNPLKPSDNLLLRHNGDCNDKQFKLIIDLEVHTRYILVITTHRPKTLMNFLVFVSGPDNVTLTHFSKYLNWFSWSQISITTK